MAWKDFAPIPPTEIGYGEDRVVTFTSRPRIEEREKMNGEKYNVAIWDVSTSIDGQVEYGRGVRVRLRGGLETPQLGWRGRRRVTSAENEVTGATLGSFISADRTAAAADRVSANARAATRVGRRRPVAAA